MRGLFDALSNFSLCFPFSNILVFVFSEKEKKEYREDDAKGSRQRGSWPRVQVCKTLFPGRRLRRSGGPGLPRRLKALLHATRDSRQAQGHARAGEPVLLRDGRVLFPQGLAGCRGEARRRDARQAVEGQEDSQGPGHVEHHPPVPPLDRDQLSAEEGRRVVGDDSGFPGAAQPAQDAVQGR